MSTGNDPFFVVGVQRSGSTMLRLMLNRHSRLNVPFESGFIPKFYAEGIKKEHWENRESVSNFLKKIEMDDYVQKGNLVPDRNAVLSRNPSSYGELVDSMFDSLAAAVGKVRWGDKTPGYELDLDLILDLFPKAKIIHLVRDGRDIAVSVKKLSWIPEKLRYVPTIAQNWRWRTLLCHKMGCVLGEQFLEVRYEDLVLNTRDTLETICQFLGESLEEEMLRYHETAAGEMPADSIAWHQNSIKPPDPSKVNSWRTEMDSFDQTVFEDIAGDALREFGYDPGRRAEGLRARLRWLYYLAKLRSEMAIPHKF